MPHVFRHTANYIGHYILPYSIVLAMVLADQASKWFMLGLIFDPPRSIPLLPFLSLTPAYNRGISFGLLSEAGWVLPLAITILGIIVGLALPALARHWQWQHPTLFGAWLVAGGALGNVVDRVRLGQVVDFIHLYYGNWHWPIFNLADSAITLGIVFILWYGRSRDRL